LIYHDLMSQEGRREISSTAVFADDLQRIRKHKRIRPNRLPYQPRIEHNADVISRALDALDEKERHSQ